MKNRKLIIGFENRKITLSVYECNLFEKFLGLMFSQKENAKILLFSFKRKQKIAIHSFFVFYPFLAIWLDDKNKISEMKVVSPFQSYVAPKKPSFKLVEIPVNRKNRKIISLFRRGKQNI